MAKTNALTEWLNIPADQQPANHYRLLNLKKFTSDAGKIDTAAEKAIALVRRHADGKNKPVGKKLIGMIEAARGCLLNAESKSTYDKKLRGGGALPEPIELDQVIKSDTPSASTRARKKSGSMLLPIIAGTLIPLAVFVFMFSGLFDGEEKKDENPGGGLQVQNDKGGNSGGSDRKSQPVSVKSIEKTTVASKTTTGKTLPPVKVAVTPPGKKKTNGSPVSVNTDAKPVVNAIDLLKLIDPKKHVVSGNWALDGKSLVNQGGQNSRLQIPFSPPEEYQLDITATQLPTKGGLIIGLVSGTSRFTAIVDYRERYTRIYMIDRKRGLEGYKSAHDGQLLKEGVPVKITCNVHKLGVSIAVDGRTVVDWKGDFSRLSPYGPEFSIPNKTQLFIGGSPIRFEKIELRPIQSINLLKLIDPKKNTLQGSWEFKGDVLIGTPENGGSKIHVPYSLPAEYDLHAVVVREKVTRSNASVNVGLAGGGRPVTAILDARDKRNYLQRLPTQKKGSDNKTNVYSPPMKTGVPVKILYEVRKSSVAVTVDGRRRLYWRGDFSEFALPKKVSPLGPAPFTIGGGTAVLRYTELSLRIPKTKSMQVVNLLKKVDLKRDALSGKWLLENGVLLSGGGKRSQLRITNDSPEQYELHLNVTRTGTLRQASWFQVGLTGGGRQFSAFVDYNRGWTSGLSFIDGKQYVENETTKHAENGPLLKIGAESKIVCRVDGTSVRVTIDGKAIIDWKGDFARLSRHTSFAVRTSKQLSIGSYGPFKISKIELRPLGEKPMEPLPIPKNRRAVPDAAAQKKALALVKDIFKKDFLAAKTPGVKLELAEKLLEQAKRSGDDTAARFVLMQEARDLAVDAGNPSTAMSIIDAIVQVFEIDLFVQKRDALRKLVRVVRITPRNSSMVNTALNAAKAALKARQFDVGLDLARIAGTAATKTRNRGLIKRISDFRKNMLTMKKWHEEAANAEKTLATSPDDPDANLARGRYLCLIEGNWAAGLPMLAKGNDAALQATARQDIATPTDAKPTAALAEAWWNLTQKQKGDSFQKAMFADRAGHWYGKVAPHLMGLEKTRIEKRMQELGELPDIVRDFRDGSASSE